MAPLSLAFAVTVSWVKISAIFTWSQHHFRVALSRFIRLCLVPKNDLWLSLLFWRCLRVFFFLLLLPLSCYFHLGNNTECCKRPIHNNVEDGMFDVRLIRLRTSYQVVSDIASCHSKRPDIFPVTYLSLYGHFYSSSFAVLITCRQGVRRRRRVPESTERKKGRKKGKGEMATLPSYLCLFRDFPSFFLSLH